MIEEPNPEPLPDSEPSKDETIKPKDKRSIVINTLIFILFFFAFCHIKGCKGNYSPVSGYQLSLAALASMFKHAGIFLMFSPVLIMLGAALLGLIFSFGEPSKMAKRIGICGIVGSIAATIFIICCVSSEGVILDWPPLVVGILHLINGVYYLIPPRIREDAPG